MLRRLNDNNRVFLPGHGLVRPGKLVPASDVPDGLRRFFQDSGEAFEPAPAKAAPAKAAPAKAAPAKAAPQIDDIIDGYDALSVSKVKDQLDELDESALRLVFDYEQANKCRKGVLSAIEELLAE